MSHISSGQPLPDILAQGLKVVFCGINPGLAAAASGHHFLGRGNRFWPVLHQAGFTPHLVAPYDDSTVLAYGLGLTCAVARATGSAADLHAEEFTQSAEALLHKLEFYRPECIAFLGKTAYLAITGKGDANWGEQAQRLGPARVWLLPNPSGLNRNFSLGRLVAAYADLRRAVIRPR